MSYAYSASDQATVARVVRSTGFKQLLKLPAIAWQEVGIVLGSYTAIIGGAALYLEGLLPYPVVLIVSALAVYATFTPLHDSTHRSVSRIPWLNDLIGTLAAQPMVPGATVALYRYLHLEHHRHTGNADLDPDEPMVSSGPLGRAITCMFIEVVWAFWYVKHRANRSMPEHIQATAILLLYVGWHTAWLLSPYAWEFVLLWMLPQRLGLLTVAYLFAAIQHPEGVHEHEQPFQATRMFKGGWFVRVFMISQSQHLMHHLFPMVPYYRYNAAWKLAEPELRDEPLIWDMPVGALKMPPARPLKADALLTVKIEKVEAITDEITAYTFAAANGKDLPVFAAGAHIDVHVSPGIIRQYSLTGLAESGRYSIAVKREDDVNGPGRGGSRTLHENFAEGQTLQISQARNLFELQENDRHAVLVAGGIGATPIISMAQALHQRGVSFEYHACARDAAALPFAEQLPALPWGDKVQTWLNTDTSLSAESLPRYEAGYSLYLCGPGGFMDYVRSLASERGWPEAAVHSEAFSAELSGEDNTAFSVELAHSGKVIEVPAESSLLDALQANDVAITASCMQGLCGTCQCKVLKGEVDHRDQILSPEEHAAGAMTACVSRGQEGERLLLDF